MLYSPSMDAHLQFAIELAQETGQLLMGYFRRAGLQSSLKADRTVVTEADLAADHLIRDAILRRYPQDEILSEELSPAYPDEAAASGRDVWIVDPVDGTTNFSLGVHIWGVLIARLVGGRPETAVMHFPAIGELYTAQRGQGAWLNGEPIYTRPPVPGLPAAFFTCCSRTFRRYQVSVPYKARILGSAAYSLCSVAHGVAVLGFEATPKIWDIAGPWLLVQEAGGEVGTLDGSQPFPLQTGLDYVRQSFPTLAAANPEMMAKGQAQIIPK